MKKRGSLLWYLNLPVRLKLLLWFIPLMITFILVNGIYSYNLATKDVLNNIVENQENIIVKTMDQFNYIAEDLTNFTDYLFISGNVRNVSSIENTSGVTRRSVHAALSKLIITNPLLDSLVIYSINEDQAWDQPFAINQQGLTSAMSFYDFKNTKMYEDIIKNRIKGIFHFLESDYNLFSGSLEQKIIFSRVIKDNNTLQDASIVVLGIKETLLRNNYMTLNDHYSELYIIDNNGTVVTGSNSQWVGNNFTEIPPFLTLDYNNIDDVPKNVNTDKWIMSTGYSPLTDWNFVVIQPKQEVLKEVNRIGFMTILLMAVCILVMVSFTWMAASKLTKPLETLSQSMNKLEKGDFTQEVRFEGFDEIGNLGHRYDQMVKRIKELIDDVYSLKLKQREAEIKSLQAQINPHFLYNTLNTICWTAQRQGSEEIADMTYALSQVFRISLNDGKNLIEIEKEVELVKNYLYLQEIRFKPRLEYEISLDKKSEKVLIPKLLIQPFVENAVIHGIEPSEGSGFIHISTSTKEEYIVISITDNGVGIKEDKLQLLKEEFTEKMEESTNSRLGYAIVNIKERLQLIYGGKAKLYFHSVIDYGTLVEIYIPLYKIGEIEND